MILFSIFKNKRLRSSKCLMIGDTLSKDIMSTSSSDGGSEVDSSCGGTDEETWRSNLARLEDLDSSVGRAVDFLAVCLRRRRMGGISDSGASKLPSYSLRASEEKSRFWFDVSINLDESVWVEDSAVFFGLDDECTSPGLLDFGAHGVISFFKFFSLTLILCLIAF